GPTSCPPAGPWNAMRTPSPSGSSAPGPPPKKGGRKRGVDLFRGRIGDLADRRGGAYLGPGRADPHLACGQWGPVQAGGGRAVLLPARSGAADALSDSAGLVSRPRPDRAAG